MRNKFIFLLCSLIFLSGPAWTWYPQAEPESILPRFWLGKVVGSNSSTRVDKGSTLIEVAQQGGLGYRALINANPSIDPWLPQTDTELLLPYATLLPANLEKGITINLAEFRLYLVWEEAGEIRVRIYPIGLGREGWNTPEGEFQVTVIIEDPVWTVPPGLRAEHPGEPAMIAPGPENPLGSHWLGLSIDGYGIHGTNRPFGIGRRISHGCIRLYPEDILDLVGKVESGAPVKIIYQPIKMGLQGGQLLLEVHSDYLGRLVDPLSEIRRKTQTLGWQEQIDQLALDRIIRETRGIPLPISSFY